MCHHAGGVLLCVCSYVMCALRPVSPCGWCVVICGDDVMCSLRPVSLCGWCVVICVMMM